MPLPLIILSGPTAIGKSQFAYQLCEKFPFEIISVDSAQVYCYMDIGTAKADRQTLLKYPHHLINLINPDQSYSAATFCQQVLQLIPTIHARGKIPLLVGGTMLYLNSLINGLSDLPSADPVIRAQIAAEIEKEGLDVCYQKLSVIDPISAERLKANDSQRIQRALEVYYSSGKPLSAYYHLPRQVLPYPYLHLALLPKDRFLLQTKINQRFKKMLNCGLIEEVEMIIKLFPALDSNSTSMRSVGYRQSLEYLQGKISLSQLEEKGAAATRQLAKRQITWLNNSLVSDKIICYLAENSQQATLYQLIDKIKTYLNNLIH